MAWLAMWKHKVNPWLAFVFGLIGMLLKIDAFAYLLVISLYLVWCVCLCGVCVCVCLCLCVCVCLCLCVFVCMLGIVGLGR